MRSALRTIFAFALFLTFFAPPASPQAQVNASDLFGVVKDPSGALVPGVKVTVRNLATNVTRTDETDQEGGYRFLGLPPGRYEVTFEARGFAKLVNREVTLTIGQAAQFDATMQLAGAEEVVTVTEATELIETSRTATSDTINQRRIENLPINGRNYINFTLTNSQALRDNSPSIGAAPNSGINFGGQRARSNEVSVDGADAVDNSVNAIRSTVSQEAVQEFQIVTNTYMPEFGRAMGGVINIVTKGGTNEHRGNLFGFIRHKDIQARNPFSAEIDPATGALRPVKQPFTRAQAGATLGGPIKKDKTFYFLSYETTRRQESGFSSIGANNFSLVSETVGPPFLPSNVTLPVTVEQKAFIDAALASGVPALQQTGVSVFAVAGSAASVALTGIDPGLVAGSRGVSALPGRRFPVPIDCLPPSIPCSSANLVPLPASFIRLNLDSVRGNYPVSEGTSLWSARIDHHWNQNQTTFLRASASPSLVTGIQVNAQNQNFGQNAFSRTSLQQYRDLAIVAQHQSTFSDHWLNEARFQFARRGLHYGFSRGPVVNGVNTGGLPGINIGGFGFFGREPFSTVDRIERRFQWTDNLSYIHGHHTFKYGADVNVIQLRSKIPQIFTLNFGGVINFGTLTALQVFGASTAGPLTIPGLNAVQAYGLGLPSTFIQGVGSSSAPFDNKTVGLYIQDSYRVRSNFTLNYGVRYDVEVTPIFPAANALTATAEGVLRALEGIPRDMNNWSPRVGFAWDPANDGKTVIRAGYGLFFDHPLLALAFNSRTANGVTSTQQIIGGGLASRANVLTPAGLTAMNAASIFQGVLNAPDAGPFTFGYLPNEQRFKALFEEVPNSIFINQNFLTAGFPIPVLPFTLHVDRNFRYGYAQQGSLTVEREVVKNLRLSVGYSYTHGLHLNRPRNTTPSNPALLVNNLRNAIASGLFSSATDPRSVVVPGTGSSLSGCPANSQAVNTAGGGSVLVSAPNTPNTPGVLGTGFTAPNCSGTNVGFIGTAAVFNFFRPIGPNPSFATTVGVGVDPARFAGLQTLARLAGYPAGTSGVPIPFSDVNVQESTGKSIYHALTVNVAKRFSHHFEFLGSYTWSHAIDDSTDLQTLLNPQDNNRPDLERSNSTFDQRHRFVLSAVFESPFNRHDPGFWNKFLADFVFSPIVEIGSGRTFTVLTGTDFNLDFGPNTDRPSVAPAGTSGSVPSPFVKNFSFIPPTNCPVASMAPLGCTGNVGRNAFVKPGFAGVDIRLSRKIYVAERINLEIIGEAFNLFNRTNISDVNPLCNPLPGGTCLAGQPTAAFDARQFQFGMKFNF